MKNNKFTINRGRRAMGIVAVAVLSVSLLAGCGENGRDTESVRDTVTAENDRTENNTEAGNLSGNPAGTEDTVGTENPSGEEQMAGSGNGQLEVRFGDDGEAFMMTLLDNETAEVIAGYVGTSDWRLPIYERDADADYSVLQYYDIPSRYEIPSAPETVTEAKAGDVFYSDPNRIVLFYHDAEVSAEYTKIGTFDATEEFITAVEENPVLEGWGNKIIRISQP